MQCTYEIVQIVLYPKITFKIEKCSNYTLKKGILNDGCNIRISSVHCIYILPHLQGDEIWSVISIIPFAAKCIKVEKFAAKTECTEFLNLKDKMAGSSVAITCLFDNQIWIYHVEQVIHHRYKIWTVSRRLAISGTTLSFSI